MKLVIRAKNGHKDSWYTFTPDDDLYLKPGVGKLMPWNNMTGEQISKYYKTPREAIRYLRSVIPNLKRLPNSVSAWFGSTDFNFTTQD